MGTSSPLAEEHFTAIPISSLSREDPSTNSHSWLNISNPFVLLEQALIVDDDSGLNASVSVR